MRLHSKRVNGSRRDKKAKHIRFVLGVVAGNKGLPLEPYIRSMHSAFEDAYGYASTRQAIRAASGPYKPQDKEQKLAYGKSKARGGKVTDLTAIADYIPSALGKRATTREAYEAPRPALRERKKDGTIRGLKQVFSKS